MLGKKFEAYHSSLPSVAACGRTADEAGRDVIVTALEPATSPADTN